MATQEQIDTLRDYIAEPADSSTSTWTDEQLSTIIDLAASLEAAAVDLWGRKAAAASALVDISEGGSSRKNSQVATNARDMAALFQARIDLTAEETRGTRIRRLAR